MASHPPALDHMLAAWNERDADQIRSHLEAALSPEAHFVDPSIETRGIDEFEANVREFRARLPDAVCSRTSGIDAHHGLQRYEWAIHRGNELLLAGFDVTQVDAQGRVCAVYGFFGPLPATPG